LARRPRPRAPPALYSTWRWGLLRGRSGRPPYSGSCSQSNNGYPELLDSEKHIHLQVNATCAGATTSTVAETQLSALTPGVELVTLTVGGNDLGFRGLAGPCLAGTQEDCLKAIGAAEGKLSGLGGVLTELYGDVAEAAPKALIVVTGYPYLLEPDQSDDAITAFNGATTALNTTIANAVIATHNDNIVYFDATVPSRTTALAATRMMISSTAQPML
jgi:lysophospholipase L1-like esterase